MNSALVVRTRDGLKLTPQGHTFLEYCRSLTKLTEGLQESFHKDELKYEAVLQLGTYESIAIYFFPYFLKYLKDRQKKLKISLKTSSSSNLMEELKMSRLDMIVSVNPKPHKSVISKTLYRDTFGFYSKTSSMDPKSLSFIGVRKATDEAGKSVESYLQDFKLSKFDWIDCASFETVKALCTEGLGVAVLPQRVAAPLLKQKILVEVSIPKVPKNFGEHSVGYSYLKSRETDSAIKWVYSEMQNFLLA
jgi:DNA-binding transcriptional LysR family regulator